MPINRRQFLRATASGAAMCAAGCITDHVHQNLLYPIYLQGDLADAALAAAAAAGAEDASVRMVRCRAIRVQATSGGAVLAAEQSAFGAGVRAWVGGREGFAAGIDLNAARIAALMRQAVACASVPCAHLPAASAAPATAGFSTRVEHDPFAVPLERRVADCLGVEAQALAVSGVNGASTAQIFLREDRYFASLDGRRIQQTWVRGQVAMQVLAGDVTLCSARPFAGGYEAVERMRFADCARQLGERAVEAQRDARALEAGEYDLVLAPAAVGALLRRSAPVLARAAACVTIVADRTEPLGLGTIGFDDEGTPGGSWDVMRRGTRTGTVFDHGCALGEGYWEPVGPSLPNLLLEPSAASLPLAALIERTEQGLLIDAIGAVYQLAGDEILLTVPVARTIVGGRLGDPVRDFTVACTHERLWQSCDVVGSADGVEWHSAAIDPGALALPRHAGGTACPPARFARIAVAPARESLHA